MLIWFYVCLPLFGDVQCPQLQKRAIFDRAGYNPQMEYSIQIDAERDMIVVAVTGNWELETGREMSRRLNETVISTGIQRILVDMRQVDIRVSILQIYERTKELWDEQQRFRNFTIRVSVALTLTDPNFENDMKFFETAAQNRNLPFHIFGNMKEALDWLK